MQQWVMHPQGRRNTLFLGWEGGGVSVRGQYIGQTKGKGEEFPRLKGSEGSSSEGKCQCKGVVQTEQWAGKGASWGRQ